MKVSLHLPDFTWDGGSAALRGCLGEVAREAEQAGTRARHYGEPSLPPTWITR
jgi:hypothetical protein